MTESIAHIVAAHLTIWNSPAGEERSRSIASTYADDVLVAEADAVYHGPEGAEKAIDALQAAVPGTRLDLDSPIQTTQDLSTYTWTLGPAGGAPVATGRDVITVRDGVVKSVYVLIDAPQQ
ncbi:hypothetical protein [Streptomyces sp. NBC_00986]|uniref:hypothetical protein n=1 Tax=Streptomyces sp. NBC_00986 TaxID=2903702 RepID=UPI0038698EC5|nr:nuclear transport factor 2 family protein [Streptomyces sp. NBC_00986]